MKTLISLVIVIVCSMEAHAIDFLKKGKSLFKRDPVETLDFSAWRDTANLKKMSEEGLPLFYPENDGEEVIVRGEIPVQGKSAEKIFLGTLNYLIDILNTENETDKIIDINPNEKTVTIQMFYEEGAYNKELSFVRAIEFKAKDGKLSFRNSEIDVKFRDKGLIPKTLAIEKLNPHKNTRDLKFIERFAEINTEWMYGIANNIKESKENLSVTHWKQIGEKEVVPGMTALEVKIILGQPLAARDNGDVTRWIYQRNLVVLFEKGLVQKVVK